MSKMFKVKVVATKTMWVSQSDLDEDCADGMIAMNPTEISQERAIDYCKGTLIEELRNNPNRGSAYILSIYDPDTKTLKNRRKYFK